MATQYQLTPQNQGITCHAWNHDRSMIAICPNSNEIFIYETTTWTKLHTLSDHDLLVSAIDWSAANNKIVSCSHDRNAFVWTFEEPTFDGPNPKPNGTWKPALVILRIDRAAMDVKWSLDGLRFAVTSSAKCVPVCTYESTNDWWVSKMLKKFKSTVLCCAFHPTNGQLLATGSSDFKCRVFSTFSSDVDGEDANGGPFGAPKAFGEFYLELSALGWVNAVAWSPSGNVLAFAGQDSTVHLAHLASGSPQIQTVQLRDLPYSKLLFLSERALVGSGHDFKPALLTATGAGWAFSTYLDKKKEEAATEKTGGVSAARALFQNKTTRGQETKSESDVLWTQHENAITDMCVASVARQSVTAISTSGLDGRLVIWNLPALEIGMATLGL